MAQAQAQGQIQLLQAQIAQLQGQAMESQADAQEAQARAQKLLVEAQLLPEQARIELVKGLSANMVDPSEQEFERRAKVAELLLKERDIDVREKIVTKQMQ
jgi:hypothetical protein